MSDIAISILMSLVASGALASMLIWLSKEWITNRLRTSIQHEYDQKLESLKAQLKAQSDVALVELRATIERQASVFSAAHASFADGQRAAMERKLRAVDAIWGRILTFRSKLPPILGFVDLLTVDEYKGIKSHPTFETLSQGWSLSRITQLMDAEVEQVRPYVGEYMWAVYWSYQAVMLRIVYLLIEGRDDAEKLEWHKDSGTRQLIQAVLTSEEVKQFDKTSIGKITWLQRTLESKILAAVAKLVSGEEFGADALAQAQLIQQRAAHLQEGRAS